MNYAPPGYYLRDFWLIYEAPEYHLFHLQAPRSPPDPELRHNSAAIGHAISRDLRHWIDKGESISPGKPGEWDDLSVWTGSVIKSGMLSQSAQVRFGNNGAPLVSCQLCFVGSCKGAACCAPTKAFACIHQFMCDMTLVETVDR